MTEGQNDSKQKVSEVSLDDLLLSCQKLDAVCSLTAGAAHNFNNIFGGLLGQFALARRSDLTEKEKETVYRLIEELLQRGIWISSRLAQFNRKTRDSIIEVRPSSVVHEVVETLGLLSSSHQINARMEEDLPAVCCSQHELLMVLFYLGRHAIASMPEGGTITFSLNQRDDSRTHIAAVVFTLSYQGVKAPAEWQELFFDSGHAAMNLTEKRSTYPSLFMVKHFVETHGGTIAYSENPISGCTVTIVLPGAESSGEGDIDSEEKKRSGLAVTEKSEPEVILLVEDEESMRFLMTSCLQKAGHIVFSVETGQEAIEEYAQLHDTITVIVMDVGLPDTTGQQCVRRLLDIDPAVAVLYVSGELLDANELYPVASPQLLKPFMSGQLKEAVRNATKG